jgi:hypothetical protein
MNEKSQGNKRRIIFQRKKKMKTMRNHKRGDRTAEQPWRTERLCREK